jgi:PEP-CTERM motif
MREGLVTERRVLRPGGSAGVSFTTPDSGWFGIDNVSVTAANPVPEPTSVVLLATGLAALSGFRIYRRH